MAARRRARPKPLRVALPEIDWAVSHTIEHSKVDGHPIRIVNFSFRRPGERAFRFALPAEEAYDLREDIGLAYDQVN